MAAGTFSRQGFTHRLLDDRGQGHYRGIYIVNSVAVRLGRTGYEKLTAVTDSSNYSSLGGPLNVMLSAFSFPPGGVYADHVSTDRAAGYGVAALVGMLVGAKVAKVAAAGGLALFFKPILAF